MNLSRPLTNHSLEHAFQSAQPLRVMIVSEFPYNGVVIGGVQSAVQILAEALSCFDAIEKVLVVSFNLRITKDEIIRVNEKLTVHQLAGQRHLGLPTMSVFDYLKAAAIAREFKPDVVHGQGTGNHGDVGIRLGYPSVLTIHGAGTFEVELREKGNKIIGPPRVWLTTRMTERSIRNAHVVISISEFDKSYSFRFRSGNVVGIPNAVRQEFFVGDITFPESPRIVFNGLVIERKNVVGLVRAFAKVKERVPNAVLDIAGPMPDKAYFERVHENILPSIKNDIVFHGNLNGSDLSNLMRSASVAVLFSIYENLPVAIAEAMALGKPVVSSRVGGIAEMIQDGENGFLVDENNVDGFADKIVTLLNDPSLRKRMGERGNEMARQRWLPERVAAETLRTYNLAIETARKHAVADRV